MSETSQNNEQLLYSVVVRLGDMEKQLKRAADSATGTYRLMKKESKSATDNMAKDAERATTRINRALASTSSKIGLLSKTYASAEQTFSQSFKGLFIGLAGAFTLRNATSLADQYTSIENALKSTGLTGKQLTDVFDGLYAAAQRNSTPIASLVQLYSRLSFNQKELGTDTQGIIHFTDTISQLLRAGGTSAQEASGALLQLSQALGSSRIQAEEFNSIVDGAPTILRAAANGIKEAGGSVSKLRQLVLDGKLSNQAFFRGIEVGAGQITQNLAGTSTTVSQAMTNLYNSMVKAVGRFNKSAEATDTFGKALQELSTTVDNVDMNNLVKEVNQVIMVLKESVEWFLKFSEKATEFSNNNRPFSIGDALDSSGITDAVNNNLPSWFFNLQTPKTRAAAQKAQAGGQEGKTEWKRQGEESGKSFTEGAEDAIQQWYKNKYPNGVKDALREEGTTVLSSRGQGKPSATKQDPVSVKDYPVIGSKDGKGSKKKLNDYQQEIRSIQEQTASLNAERDALAQLNPLVDDNGYAVEKAQAKQKLLNAAKREHLTLTPELTAEIERESESLAKSVASKNQVIATQEKLKKSIEETKDIAKDFSRTLTDGLINNKKFVDALGDAFLRLGQRFADSAISTAIDNVFKLRTTNTASNSGSNLFSSLFGGLFGGKGFASGTANTGGMRGEPIGIVHGQEAVIPLPNGGKVPVQIFTGRQETQTKPRLSEPAQRVNLSVHVAPSDMFDVHVREIAQQVSQQNIREYHKNLPNLIGQTINEAQTKNRM
ncbi:MULTISPECIES: tape measure protein [Bartonella]|uniref:tape measure protein n=1 Tax=Bartonella TaxID=773 RepID=UPI0018DCC04E|nr:MULTISPECIES: tape measure protein [Bartonella]MBH9974492.1 tape measure protein [Bartonella choladocola]MBI0014099.1 tape measure protein [Bartonella sp. B10834G3]